MGRIRIAQVGLGYWGPNLLRNLVSLPDCQVTLCCDLDPERLARFQAQYPLIRFTQDWSELLASDADGVVIATPAVSHFQMVSEALRAEKHVLVEKPLALTAAEARALVDLAQQADRKLMVGYTFLYNPAVRKLREYITSNTLGDVMYLYSRRLNLGRVRADVNALWNLAPHDVSIVLYLLDEVPVKVSAHGACYLQPDVEDVAFVTLEFASGVIANVHVSWLNPLKVRQMVLVGTDRMVVYDDTNKDTPLALYDSGIVRMPEATQSGLGHFEDYGQFQGMLRSGDVMLPKISPEEPLKIECRHFVECIANGSDPLTDGLNGLHVTRVLEAAQQSLKLGGTPVEIAAAQG
jgi:predicted dehydrogenase